MSSFHFLVLNFLISSRVKSHRFFPIRNQKLFVKESDGELTLFNKQYYNIVYPMIYNSLIDSLKTKATTVSIPNGVSIKLPASAKSFIGNPNEAEGQKVLKVWRRA